jgi:hyperosmotically inducible periplasmic protein
MKRLTLATACAAIALAASPALAQDKPQEKPKETTIVIKDDTTPKVKKAQKAVTDASITTAVNTRLLKDKAAADKSIEVHTKAGVVTLTGAVPTEADKVRIGGIVQRTTGVKRVENDLVVSAVGTTGRADADKDTKVVIKDDVKPTTVKIKDDVKDTKVVIKDDTTPAVKKGARTVGDASVTAAVKTRLTKDEISRDTSIDVDTEDGVVTLSGTVPTEAAKTRIGDITAKTTGVKRVVNNLTVK